MRNPLAALALCILFVPAHTHAQPPRPSAAQAGPATHVLTPARPCATLVDAKVDTVVDTRQPGGRGVLRPKPGVGPEYPAAERNAKKRGQVFATFVIDSLGVLVPGSAQITEESDRAFSDAVCNFLKKALYEPTVIGGRNRAVRFRNVGFGFSMPGAR